ncbi:MAG TPA: amino acid synthesis family protein [Eoetvoesiella sp.]
MSQIKVRKKILNTETVYHEGGPVASNPLLLGVVAVVLQNPFAGRFVEGEELSAFVTEARDLANTLVPELVQALGGKDKIQAYGKGAIVGTNGELEHGAIWHEAGGWAMRAVLSNAKSIVPTCKFVGAAGSRLHVPLHHIEASYVRSHFNTMEVSVGDSPRPDELLYALAMCTGPRIHERLGGLRVDQISVHDGQR